MRAVFTVAVTDVGNCFLRSQLAVNFLPFATAPETDLLPPYEAVKLRTFINISLTELNCEARGHTASFYAGSDIIVYMDFRAVSQPVTGGHC